MPPRKKTTTKKTTTPRPRTRVSKLASFAPESKDFEVVRPAADARIMRLEAASVFLGMASVVVAALGYWYVFGAPVANPAPAFVDNSTAAVEHAGDAASEHYKIAPAGPETIDTTPAPTPSTTKVAIYSTVSVKGAAAELQKDLQAAGFKVPTIGNQRPLQATTTILMKEGSQSLAESLRSVVAKKYEVVSVGTLPDSSKFDAVIVIGTK